MGECKLGCVFGSRPASKPVPPVKPTPPAPRGDAPACGVFPAAGQPGFSPCVIGNDVNFSTVFSNHAVLQMEPAHAAVYGYLGKGAQAGSKVTVSVVNTAGQQQQMIDAIVDATKGTWKALLKPSKGLFVRPHVLSPLSRSSPRAR